MWARHPDRPDAQRGPYSLETLIRLIPTQWSSPTGLMLARTTTGPWLGCEKFPGIHQMLSAHSRPLDHYGAWRNTATMLRSRGDRRLALSTYQQLTHLFPKAAEAWRDYGRYCLDLGLEKESRRAAEELRKVGATEDADDLVESCEEHARRRAAQPRDHSNAAEPSGETDEVGLRAGSTIAGRYRLISKLGRGGMGVVWKASDMLIEDTVALKVMLHRHGTKNAKYFQREVKLARRVSHVNVCRVYEAGTFGPHPFITMEFVEGMTLAAALRTPRSTQWRMEVLRGIAEALAAIHAEGIVHRDLKPGNVMVTDQATVKVMDFGLARPFTEGDSRATGPLIGTLAYMSPEQLRGAVLDHRTDVYAFGVLAWEVFTGKLPHRGGDEATLESRLRGEMSDVGRDFLPPGIVDAVMACLAAKPSNRPASVEPLLDILRADTGSGGS